MWESPTSRRSAKTKWFRTWEPEGSKNSCFRNTLTAHFPSCRFKRLREPAWRGFRNTGKKPHSDKTTCAVGAPPSMKIEFSGLVRGDGSVCGTKQHRMAIAWRSGILCVDSDPFAPPQPQSPAETADTPKTHLWSRISSRDQPSERPCIIVVPPYLSRRHDDRIEDLFLRISNLRLRSVYADFSLLAFVSRNPQVIPA